MRLGLTPSLAFQLQQARQNAGIRAQLQQVSTEVVTGRRADVLEATRGRLGDALSLQKASADVIRYQKAAALAGARIDGVAGSVSAIRASISNLGANGRVAIAQGQPAGLQTFVEEVDASLSQVMSALNRRQGNRYLFSGTQTNAISLAAPQQLKTAVNSLVSASADAAGAIAAADAYFSDPIAGFSTDIYQGSDTQGPRLHISPDQSLAPLPNADEESFRTVMKGLTLITEAHALADPDEQALLMNHGLDLIGEATGSILTLEAKLGANQQALERMEADLSAELGLLGEAERRMLGKDTFEAAAELQALEAQLQASYTVTGRLGALTLTNFLR